MIRSLLGILLMFSFSSGQILLSPGKSYRFDSTMYAYNERQILKIDSIFRESEDRSRLIRSLEDQLRHDRELIDSLSSRVNLLKGLNDHQNEKISLLQMNDSLIRKDAQTYRELYRGANELLIENSKARSNSTFWFISGSVAGMFVVYLSSMVLNNIGN